MHTVDNHFPLRKAPAPNLSNVRNAQTYMGEHQNHNEGKYRIARDYPIGVYSYLDCAEVEKIAHNAANYDAAEALDLN